MERTFIIEYRGGTKGDLLTNYLNNEKIIFEENNKTKTFVKRLDPWKYNNNYKPLQYLYKKQEIHKFKTPPLIWLSNWLDETKKYKFSNSHAIDYFYKKEYKKIFMEKNIKIKKIIFDEKYYRTIALECIFKNWTNDYDIKIKKFLKMNNLNITKKNIYFAINVMVENDIHEFFLYNKFKKNLDNKDLINYEDLYLNFSTDDKELQNLINCEYFKKIVDKSWLPEEILVFGNLINLKDLGYMKFKDKLSYE